MEAFLVSDNLDRYHFACLMISTAKDLAERAFTKSIDDFKAKQDMITLDDLIIPSLVIVSIIVSWIGAVGHFFVAAVADEVYLLIFEKLVPFIVGKVTRICFGSH